MQSSVIDKSEEHNNGYTCNDLSTRGRRVLHSFLLMIEQDNSHSLIVTATDRPDTIEPALFRRLDDILHYDLLDQSRIAKLLKPQLGAMAPDNVG